MNAIADAEGLVDMQGDLRKRKCVAAMCRGVQDFPSLMFAPYHILLCESKMVGMRQRRPQPLFCFE